MDRRTHTPPSSAVLRLRGARAHISVSGLRSDARLIDLAVDDAVWIFEVLDWQRHAPRRIQPWHARRWERDGDELYSQREELQQRARSLGLAPSGSS